VVKVGGTSPVQLRGTEHSKIRPSSLATEKSVTKDKSLVGLRILVVDDALDNQQLLSRYLVKQGAIVEPAENGLVGFKKALAGNYDVVLMDIQMPIMDGYTATQKLRDAGFSKPIIALTAHAMTEVRQKSFDFGYTDHLTKPINAVELFAVIAQHADPRAVNPVELS
jgi:CheY-like chemotaxis protein